MADLLSNTLIAISLAFLVFFVYCLRRHRNRFSDSFPFMCLCVAIYVMGYAFELRSDNLRETMFFIKLEYFGLPFMTAFWALFAYRFANHGDTPLRLTTAVLVIPCITSFLCVTNEYHHLFYTSVTLVDHGPISTVTLGKGPWYYVNIVYSYAIVLYGTLVFFRAWRRSGYNTNTQAFWLFFGSLWPSVVNVFYLAGLSPYNLDVAPFSLSVLAVSYFIAIFRYDILDIRDIVRGVVFEGITEGIIVVDDRNRLVDHNAASRGIFGWLSPDSMGRGIADAGGGEGNAILSHGSGIFEMALVRDGAKRFFEFRATELEEDGKPVGRVFFITDITAQKEMILELGDLASYDQLTRVYNRRRFMEEAEREVLRARRYGGSLSVIIIDIDRFKRVNDTFGHLAGDEVIRTVVMACKGRIRTTDTIGRYGGEEFVLLIPGGTHADALRIAEDIRTSVSDTVTVFDAYAIRVTISAGVATFPAVDETTDILRMINAADTALYNSKNSGRDRVSGVEPQALLGA